METSLTPLGGRKDVIVAKVETAASSATPRGGVTISSVTPATTIITPSVAASGVTTEESTGNIAQSSWPTPEAESEEENEYFESCTSPPNKKRRISRSKPSIVSIEGIPGSGKSGLLD